MTSLRCRVGRHRWTTERTEDGKPYRICSRCRHEAWNEPSRPGLTDGQGGFSGLGDALGPP